MKKITTAIILLFSFTIISAQIKTNGKFVKPKGLNIDKNTTPGKQFSSKLTGFGPYSTGKGKNKIEFSFKASEVALDDYQTKLKPKKTVETSENCTKDLYKSSGSVSTWKVYDDEGNSNIDDIVPGAIYDISKYNGTFFPAVEKFDRNPFWVSNTSSVQSTITKKKVQNPKFIEKIRDAAIKPIQNSMKRKNFGSKVKIVSSFERVYSEQDMNIAIGGAVPYPFGKVTFNASHGEASSSDKYVYMLELEEVYYKLKATGNTIAQSKFFKDEKVNGNNYAYVESVTYGRRIIVKIESSESMESHNNSIEVSNSGVVDAEVDYSSSSLDESFKFSYEIILIGGATNNNISLTSESSDLDKLLKELSTIVSTGNKDVKDGMPIKFTLKDFDHNALATTYSPFESEVENCNAKFKISYTSMTVTKLKDAGKKIELYGSFKVKGYESLGGSQFYSDETNTLIDKLGTIEGAEKMAVDYAHTNSGKTTFATKDTPYKREQGNPKEIDQGTKESGDHIFQVTNDATSGYFLISVDAWDKDGLSKDDEIDGDSQKIYFTDIAGKKEITINATGKGNVVKFVFLIEKVN